MNFWRKGFGKAYQVNVEISHISQEIEAAFDSVSPVGYFYALRIGFAFPVGQGNRLSAPWVELYTRKGLFFSDPLVRWAYGQTGVLRWSDVPLDDPLDVLGQAKGYGMPYGCVASVAGKHATARRSIAILARDDREMTESELERVLDALSTAHADAAAPRNITQAELEALGMVKNGLRLKEIAFQLGVTEGAVKQRLKNAKNKLGATTSAHAASLASSLGLI